MLVFATPQAAAESWAGERSEHRRRIAELERQLLLIIMIIIIMIIMIIVIWLLLLLLPVSDK